MVAGQDTGGGVVVRQSDFISSCWQQFTGTVEADEAGKDVMPPWYRCVCQRDTFNMPSPLGCVCGGRGKLTGSQAIEVYGFIPYYIEIPYCHICLNENVDYLFPYAVFDFGGYLDDQKQVYEGNAKFIYRCRYDHGHDKGWGLVNIITGLVVCL